MFSIIARELSADWLEWIGKTLMNAAMDPILPDGWLGENPRDFRCICAILVGSAAGACMRASEKLDG